jgi:hypothetical protein
MLMPMCGLSLASDALTIAPRLPMPLTVALIHPARPRCPSPAGLVHLAQAPPAHRPGPVTNSAKSLIHNHKDLLREY